MTFGDYPHVGPKDARDLHFAAKKLLAAGTNPMSERKAEAEAKQQQAKDVQREADSSFEKVARKWWAWWSIGKSPRHAETLMNRLEADVFPVIGHLPIDAVQTTHIRIIIPARTIERTKLYLVRGAALLLCVLTFPLAAHASPFDSARR